MKTRILLLFCLLFLPLSGRGQDTPVDGSGTITAGGTSQTVFAVNSGRRYFEFQNISDTGMYVNFGGTATADSNSFYIAPGGAYVNPSNYCPKGIITVICATTGKKFVAKQAG